MKLLFFKATAILLPLLISGITLAKEPTEPQKIDFKAKMAEKNQRHLNNFHQRLIENRNAMEFLKGVQPNLDKKIYEFLQDKVSQLKSKTYLANKIANYKYAISSKNTSVRFSLVHGNNSFKINNRDFNYDPLKSPSENWDGIVSLLPRGTARTPLLDLFAPRADAAVLQALVVAAILAMAGAAYFSEPDYNEDFGCLHFETFLLGCNSALENTDSESKENMESRTLNPHDQLGYQLAMITNATDIVHSPKGKRLNCDYLKETNHEMDKEAESKKLTACAEALVKLIPYESFEKLKDRVKKHYKKSKDDQGKLGLPVLQPTVD